MQRFHLGFLVGLFALLPVMASAAEPVFANKGSVGLVPPAGMVESTGVQGFEDRAAKASILIVEMPPPAYAEVTSNFTNAALAQKGVTIERREDVTLADGSKALLLGGYQSVGAIAVKKWVLVAGGKDTTALVTVQLPEESSIRYPDASIEAALKSVVFRPPPTTQQLLAQLPFRVEALDGYRVVKVLGGSAVLLTKGPDDTLDGAAQPFFIAAAGQGDIREEERESFAKRAITSVPGVRELRIERGGPLRIGGQPGFELVAKGEDAKTGKPVKIAQWLRFSKAGYIRMVGVAAAEGFDKDFTSLRALRDGVEMR